MSQPITKQRSQWNVHSLSPAVADLLERDGIAADLYTRNVSDGVLRAFVAEEPPGLHLSISFVNHKGDPTRYPTWDEIIDARERLLPFDVGFVMHLPSDDEYVALHPTTFHLWEFPARDNVE